MGSPIKNVLMLGAASLFEHSISTAHLIHTYAHDPVRLCPVPALKHSVSELINAKFVGHRRAQYVQVGVCMYMFRVFEYDFIAFLDVASLSRCSKHVLCLR